LYKGYKAPHLGFLIDIYIISTSSFACRIILYSIKKNKFKNKDKIINILFYLM
jgi:hypothetical protein